METMEKAEQREGETPAAGGAAAPIRLVTATSLYDGHDAAINVMRRLMQKQGAEVIHLGHNRSVEEIVGAAIQEDARGIAVSSYQGGHMEFFGYMVDLLRERGAGHIRLFGGGGGVILPSESARLEALGVTKIYGPEEGRRMGLEGMISHLLAACGQPPEIDWERELERLPKGHPQALARCISFIELKDGGGAAEKAARLFDSRVEELARGRAAPVLGITGTGGAGKSSLTDELVRRFLETFTHKSVAVLSVDPTRRRTGGALLGDRIRMNSVGGPRAFMRSIATRRDNAALSGGIRQAVQLCRGAGYDLVIVETAGIGQSDTEITDLADFTVYVMTPDFGAASQLEKIGMLDYADMVAINKFDKQGSRDALRDVKKQLRRNRGGDGQGEIPVHGTVASQYGDPATDALFHDLIRRLSDKLESGWEGGAEQPEAAPADNGAESPATATGGDPEESAAILPPLRERYLAEVARTVRDYKGAAAKLAGLARRAGALRGALEALGQPTPAGLQPLDEAGPWPDETIRRLAAEYNAALEALPDEARGLLARFDTVREELSAEAFTYSVRGKEISVPNHVETLSHLKLPKVGLPSLSDWGDRLSWLMLENVPGAFPYTAGVFPFKRAGEEPTRMFAGEGTPERTNRRFHMIAEGQPAVRLSTAFDSVTLYGDDPDPRPDIMGKVGNSGVSICTLDDMKRLYSGFDLTAPATSVSMTINGPAPVMLAFFLNTAIDQQVEKVLRKEGRWEAAQARIESYFKERGGVRPLYREERPAANGGLGLGLLGIPGALLVGAGEYGKIKGETLRSVRGTVQADILKEDQAQNTCIFSTEFALTMMGDVQEYFVRHDMPNFYSVSVSGYHMAEAGANPITQAAFTLANGFTYVEYYLARGLPIDAFARNLSFFFSNGMEAEYAVIGRVARRIWALTMRDKYGAGERAQKLKYHTQTSGRSLHAQEIAFNDIRTTLQALSAVYDNCNSLHTNAYDEAITTPTEESVRRAIAIQLIINREYGLSKTINPLQGSYIIEALTELVEEAILAEFDRLALRGGVLGAMESMYQRGRIQDESLYYEQLKHAGDLPIVGVNTFVSPHGAAELTSDRLSRSSSGEKQRQIDGLAQFKQTHAAAAPAALEALSQTCRTRGNIFESLMECVKNCSLGQITTTLYQEGGQYRRNM